MLPGALDGRDADDVSGPNGERRIVNGHDTAPVDHRMRSADRDIVASVRRDENVARRWLLAQERARENVDGETAGGCAMRRARVAAR